MRTIEEFLCVNCRADENGDITLQSLVEEITVKFCRMFGLTAVLIFIMLIFIIAYSIICSFQPACVPYSQYLFYVLLILLIVSVPVRIIFAINKCSKEIIIAHSTFKRGR